MTDNFDLGGSGGTSYSWGKVGETQPGAHVQGTVLDMKEVQKTNYETNKPEFWDNGDPIMQYRVTLQTELRDPGNAADDGKRDVYLDGRRRPNDNGTKSKLCAVLDAVRETTGGTQLQRGGKLTLQWISGVGFAGDPRCFQAWYEAPALNLQPPGVPQAPPAAPPIQQSMSVPQTIAHQAATGVQPPPFVPTEQGQVNTTTGEIQPPAPPAVQQPALVPAAAPAPAATNGPTREAVAALRAAGVDPANVYPGYDGSLG